MNRPPPLPLPLPLPLSSLSEESARDKYFIKRTKVTKIVSVGYGYKPVFEHIEYHLIPIDDMEDEFLLQYLPDAINFIEKGLSEDNGVVLVHW